MSETACRHCAGWGKYSVPSTHTLYGKRCRYCDGSGHERPEVSTTVFGYAARERDALASILPFMTSSPHGS